MRKKQLTYLLPLLITALAIIFFSFGYGNKEKGTTGDAIPDPNAIRQYYYDSIPGLMRAEQLDMVKPIHKTFHIPDTDFTLKIDRIWYNSREAFIFYHVENIDEIAYLGGYFSTEDKGQTVEIHPRDLIGTPTERGFFFNNSFYSFLKIGPTDHIDEDSEVQLLFRPSLHLGDSKYDLDAISIEPSLLYAEEPIEEYELDTEMELEEYSIDLYALEAGVACNKIYFMYNDLDSEIIYRLQARIITDTGENFIIDKSPILINREESKYYIEMQPFNELPDSFDLKIESLSLMGNDSIQCTIDTSSININKGIQTLKMPLARVMNRDILLETLHFKDNHVEIGRASCRERV